MRNNKNTNNSDSNLIFNKHSVHGKMTKNNNQKSNLQFKDKKSVKLEKDAKKDDTLRYKGERLFKKKPEGPKHLLKPPKMTVKEKIFYSIKVFLLSVIGLVLSGAIIIGIIIGNWLSDVPELDLSLLTNVSQSSMIYDRNGKQIANYSSAENREWVEIENIPQWIKDAIVSIEDHRYYQHPGIDFKRFIGAILGQLTGQDDYGGSTLTQQLVKNVYLTSEVTYKRKAQEIYLSLKLESKMTKDEILEAYLNIIYMGGANYGIKAAAKDYFGKELNELTLRECALIAGLTQNPNGYNPRRNMQNGDMTPTNERTDTVLYTMHMYGKISDAEYQQALNEEIHVANERTYSETYPYPHYVEYALNEVAKDMLIAEGKEPTALNIVYKKYAIRNGGYKIYTTLDQDIQNTLQNTTSTFEGYPETEDGKGVEVSAVIMDQRSGEIVAMVGSKDEPTALETFNRASDSVQPVGSTMKSIGIFAPAIELGLSPASVEADYASGIKGYDNANGFPGGECFSTPMTMREAVENSHNIPAARFLINHVGIDMSAEFLIKMGINAEHIQKTSAGIVLGTSGITTAEMTGAYATIANDGIFIEPHAYTVVLDRENNEVLNATANSIRRKVFTEATSWLTTDMLISEVNNGGGYNAKIDGITTAGKTGTHEDRCITFAGYTGYYTSALRISSDSYSAMYDASGGEQAAKLWNVYMSAIHQGLPDRPIQSKSADELGIISVEVCDISGELAGELCIETEHNHTDYYLNGTQPKTECSMHKLICSKSGALASDECIEAGDAVIGTCIGINNYLYDVDQTLLQTTLRNVKLGDLTVYCENHYSYFATPEPTPEPTEEPTPEPLPTDDIEIETPDVEETPYPVPTREPEPEPVPTEAPTPEPTEEPTPVPTEEPTPVPTEEPPPEDTEVPTPEVTVENQTTNIPEPLL